MGGNLKPLSSEEKEGKGMKGVTRHSGTRCEQLLANGLTGSLIFIKPCVANKDSFRK